MSNHRLDVLLHAEDPGAANFLIPVQAALLENGLAVTALAQGKAVTFFQHEGQEHQLPGEGMDAGEILARLRPRLILTGTSENPHSLGLALIDAAKAEGVPTVGALDMGTNAGLRFRGASKDPLRHAPDWLLLPDGWSLEQFVDFGFPEDRLVVTGHPHFDLVRQRAAVLRAGDRQALRQEMFPEAEPEATVIVFAAEVSDGLDPSQYRRSSEYTLHGRGDSPKRTDIAMEEFLDALKKVSPRPYTVLRLHPKNTRTEFAAYLAEFDRISAREPVHQLLHAADCVVGMTSMLLVEAALMDRPTFSIVPRALECDWLPSISWGVTPWAADRQALTEGLPRFIADARTGGFALSPGLVPPDAMGNVMRTIKGILGRSR